MRGDLGGDDEAGVPRGSDFFLTPTMELCDYILPRAATWRARSLWSLSVPPTCRVRQKAIEPEYDTRDEREITYEIIKRMACDSDGMDTIEKQNDFRVRSLGMTFEEFKKKSYVSNPSATRNTRRGFSHAFGKSGALFFDPGEVRVRSAPLLPGEPETPVSAPELAEISL